MLFNIISTGLGISSDEFEKNYDDCNGRTNGIAISTDYARRFTTVDFPFPSKASAEKFMDYITSYLVMIKLTS
jgi:hypothetical protein